MIVVLTSGIRTELGGSSLADKSFASGEADAICALAVRPEPVSVTGPGAVAARGTGPEPPATATGGGEPLRGDTTDGVVEAVTGAGTRKPTSARDFTLPETGSTSSSLTRYSPGCTPRPIAKDTLPSPPAPPGAMKLSLR